MKSSRWALAGIMLAVLAWGTWLAIGAVGYNDNPWRGVMVLGSVVVFLGGWLLLLWGRQRLDRLVETSLTAAAVAVRRGG